MCENLVAALTCPEFRLDELDQAVPRTVLAAAVGKDRTATGICKYASSDTGEVAGKEYTWNVERSSVLTYVAKKGDKEAFRIIFPVDNNGKSEPRVWVKDADSYQSKDAIEDLADSIIKQRQYANYCINFNGRDYYANCKQYTKTLQLTWTDVGTYATSCAAGVFVCQASLVALPFAGWMKAAKELGSGTFVYDLAGCAAAPLIAKLVQWGAGTEKWYDQYSALGLGFIGGTAGAYLPAGRYTIAEKAIRVAKLQATMKKAAELGMFVQDQGSIIVQASKMDKTALTEFANQIQTYLRTAKKAGVINGDETPSKLMFGDKIPESIKNNEAIRDMLNQKVSEIIENDKFPQEFASEIEELAKDNHGAAEMIVQDMGTHYDEMVESIAKRAEEVKKSWKKSLLCSTVGNILGSVVTYAEHVALNGNSLRYKILHVTVQNAPVVTNITVQGATITVEQGA